jgi:hypothetical protein
MESINDIAIKLSVHAEGVSAGFRTAAEEARGFQKEIDRFAYAVDKGLNRNFGPMLDAALNAQFAKDTEERIAREKKAQEDFNAWYRKEMEQEVAAYTAAEAAKEEATKTRIAAERQAALYTHNMQQIITARPLPTETEARGQELQNLEQAIRARFALMDQEQQRIQNQIAMNTTNAQRFQAVLEMETAARAQANNDLRAAITARYALLEQDERALRDNASNRAAAQARATAAAQQAHQQDLDNLREYITQKYAILNREEAIERARQRDAKRAADDARRQALNDMRADAAERERMIRDANSVQETRSIIQQIRSQERDALRARTQAQTDATRRNNEAVAEASRVIQRHLTLQERYTQELTQLTRLQHTYNTVTGAALLTDQQFGRAKTALTIATIRQQQAQRAGNAAMQQGGDVARIMTGVFTQASFAAEDFIQGIAFGDVRSALLGASNNLTMVVRGLVQAGTAAGGTGAALAGMVGWLVAIPAAVVGLGSYILWLNRAKADTRDLEQALSELNEQWIKFERLSTINRQGRREAASIARTSTSEAADTKAADLLAERVEMEKALLDVQSKVARQNREIFVHTMGGANALQELKDQIAKTIAYGSEEEVAAAEAMNFLIEDAATAASSGDFTGMIAAMRDISTLADEGSLRNWTEWVDDLGSFDALQKLFNSGVLGTFFTGAGDDLDALNAVQKALADSTLELTASERELLLNAENILNAKLKAQELYAVEERHRRLMLQLAQDEIRFQLSATEAQRESLDIQNQLAQFLGVDNPNPMMGLDPNDFSAEQVRQSAEFLELMWRDLERQKQEILDEQQRVTPIGGMEQNAFQAQADAFKQMLDAQFREEDPQLTEIARRQGRTNDILEGMTGIRIVQ